MNYRWMPLVGYFEQKKNGVTFKGEWEERPIVDQAGTGSDSALEKIPSLGISISDQEISDGTVSADITFASVGRITGCELIVGFDTETRSYLTAGLSSFPDAMFSVREWAPTPQRPGEQPRGWITYAVEGDRRNLKAKQKYEVRVDVSGSRVELTIDGVPLASVTVPPNPKRRRHVGLWCSNHADISIDNIVVQGGKPRAFVVMQFSEPYDQVYSEVVRSVCESFNLQTVRADELYGPGLIIGDVVDQIQRAQVVIADITPANANVYFEVGYALALNKQIILLARKGTELPFDVKAFRVLFYEDSIAGKAKVEEGLKRHLRAVLGA
jgi:hypothetical protein